MFAIQPQFYGIKCQHSVDGEMGANVAEEGNIAQRIQPLRVIGGNGVRWPFAEAEEGFEHAPNALHVGGDGSVRQHLPRFVLAGRVADAGGAAAQQDHGLVAVFLQKAENHDLHQAADMQAVRSAIEADIGGNRAGAHRRVQRRLVRALVNKAALFGFVKEIPRGNMI